MKTQRSLSIFLSALAFLGTTSTLTNAVQAQEQIAQSTPISRMLRTLTVSGRGTESIQTTVAQVRLGVEAQGKTVRSKRRSQNDRMQSSCFLNLATSKS